VICDEGDGLDESQHSLCQAPFFQSEDPLTRARDGLGLGIPTACRVIELHGGSLSFGPSPQAGVSARITLPLRPAIEDEDAKDRTAA
jgi:signal transduction histidine kinase